jgi:hypothetical protein
MLRQNKTKNKYNLMLCHLHNPNLDGKTAESDPNIETHYLVYGRYNGLTGEPINYEEDDEYEDDYEDDEDDINVPIINMELLHLRSQFARLNNRITHPTIRNYLNIIQNPNYIQPEIGEYIVLPTKEAVAILKTFWLRIIQKKWKQIYKERQIILQRRCNPKSIMSRERTGLWPLSCNQMPGLKGMLKGL